MQDLSHLEAGRFLFSQISLTMLYLFNSNFRSNIDRYVRLKTADIFLTPFEFLKFDQ